MSTNVVRLERPARPIQPVFEEEHQLSFEFDTEQHNSKLAIAVMDTVHGADLCRFIDEFSPKVALDMRFSIRFDVPGSSRNHIFRQLEKCRTLYSRAAVKWHDLSPSDFMLNNAPISQRLNHELFERGETPLLVFVQKQTHAQLLHSFLNRQISKRETNDWSVVYCA